MSTIQFGGVVSGLNTQGIIDALVAAKKQPLTDLQTQETTLSAQQSAYAQLGSAIDDLVSKVKNFTVTSAGAARTASSTNTSLFTAQAANSAAVAQYTISVDRLATTTRATSTGALGSAIALGVDTSQTLAHGGFVTPFTAGSLSLKVDGKTVSVAVGDPTTTTIQNVADSVASSLQAQLRAGGDAAATVTGSIVGGQVQFAVTGSTQAHDITVGAPTDSSNFAIVNGLLTQGVTGATNPTITGTATIGGSMTVTVDGTAVQIPVGDPTTTTLQSFMTTLANTLQTQLQAGGDTATVTASIVDNKLQLAVTGNAQAHDISFGAPGDTSTLATSLGLNTQGVTGVQNATIGGTAYLDPSLASLNLPGSITAGQISAIVDGTIVHYTVGDPKATTLAQVMDGFSAAIQAQLRAGGANAGPDGAATVSMSVVGNQMQLSIGGGADPHSIWFGSAGDTSNALGIFGLANQSATNALNPTLTAATNLGVARLSSSLDAAGLSGLASTKTGVLTINGVDIKYDTTYDSLSGIISRINNAGAGVIASIDRTTDKILLTRKDTGATAIDIQDTSGTLAAALKLAPGTTNAQLVGQSAQITIDNRQIVSQSNAVTNAIDGVTINLTGQSQNGATATLSVGVDTSAVASSINSFVTSFNSLANTLDKLTAQTPGTSGGNAGSSGPLASDPTAQSMLLRLRDTLFTAFGSGTLNSMGALGLSTGNVGSAVGTTNRLQLDTAKLTAALNSDATQAASLLDGSTGPLASLLAQLKSYEDPSSTSSYIQAHSNGLASQITSIQRQERDQQEMIDNYTAMIEAQYATMEATLAQLQSQSSQIASTLGYSTSSSGSGLGNSKTS